MGTEGSGTRWFHSFPAVGHRSAQDQLVAASQLAGQLRRLVGCFSLIASFRETYQRLFSSSKQHNQSLKIFPGRAGCSSGVRHRWGAETQMREGQEREAGGRRGSQPYRAAALPLASAGGFPRGTPLRETPGYLQPPACAVRARELWWEREQENVLMPEKHMHLEVFLFLFFSHKG